MNMDSNYQILKNSTLRDSNFIIALPLAAFEEASREQKRILLRTGGDGTTNIMSEIFEKIEYEKEQLLKDFSEFYSSNSVLKKLANKGNTIEIIQNLLFEKNLRMKRLLQVYKPDYYSTESIKKSSGVKYDMVKIHWINDQGIRIRQISKTYGKIGSSGLNFSIPKFLEDHIENYDNPIFEYRPAKNEFPVDLKVTINGLDWVFEFAATKKTEFIDCAVRLELWKLYKESYDLFKNRG